MEMARPHVQKARIVEADWQCCKVGRTNEEALHWILSKHGLYGDSFAYSGFPSARFDDVLKHGTYRFDDQGSPMKTIFCCTAQIRRGEVFFEQLDTFDLFTHLDTKASFAPIAVYDRALLRQIDPDEYNYNPASLVAVVKLNGY